MANLSLSTQMPQIGDSSQQLLARMATAQANAIQARTPVTWLPNATYTTSQALFLTVPSGVKGIVMRLIQTAVPGVDTVNQAIVDGITGRGIAAAAASATLENHLLILKNGVSNYVPSGVIGVNAGLTEQVQIRINHSGAGSFTYRAEYCWLV